MISICNLTAFRITRVIKIFTPHSVSLQYMSFDYTVCIGYCINITLSILLYFTKDTQ